MRRFSAHPWNAARGRRFSCPNRSTTRPDDMSASADMSSSSFGIASEPRGAALQDAGFSGGSCPWRSAWSLPPYVIMSDIAHHGNGWLPVLLLAAFLALTLGSGTASPATGGGGHGGGFSGGGHGAGGLSRGREFGGGAFGGRRVPHGHDHDRHSRPVFVFPYFYDSYYGYDPDYPDYPYDAYCDPYSPYYAPQHC